MPAYLFAFIGLPHRTWDTIVSAGKLWILGTRGMAHRQPSNCSAGALRQGDPSLDLVLCHCVHEVLALEPVQHATTRS